MTYERVPTPLAAWKTLGPKRRREVARLARAGSEHPDRHVAAVAHAWATEVIRERDVRPDTRIVRALNAVGDAVWAPEILGSLLGDRYLARKLVAAATT